MNNSLIIREYTVQDRDQVLNLFNLNSPEFFAPEEKGGLVYYLNKEIQLYYIIEFDNKIAGCGGINFEDNDSTGIISWDILHPDYHGRGLGTLLMNHRLSLLRSMKGINKIIVRTSQLTYRFYEKQGFILKEIARDYWAKGFDMYFMEYFQSS